MKPKTISVALSWMAFASIGFLCVMAGMNMFQALLSTLGIELLIIFAIIFQLPNLIETFEKIRTSFGLEDES